MLNNQEIKRRGRKRKPVVRLDIADVSVVNKDGAILYENHYKAKYIFGILVHMKRYRAGCRYDVKRGSGFI